MSRRQYIDLTDSRTYVTPKGMLLAKLYQGSKTFSKLVEETGLPRGTVASSLQKFRQLGLLTKSHDSKHKQRIFYELTSSTKRKIEPYVTLNFLEICNLD